MQPVSKLIEIQGPIGTLGDGYATHNRAFIKMLHKAGFNIKPISMEPGAKGIPMAEEPGLIQLLTDSKNKGPGDIIFNFCIPPMYRIEPNKINLAFTTWETPIVPGDWVKKINSLTALFVPSEVLRQVFVGSGVTVPIYILPFPLDKEAYTSDKITVMPSIERKYTYLYSGNYTPRKNYEDLITAFCDAFDSVTNVALVIKTIAPNNDTNTRMQIQGAIGHLANRMNGCHRRPKVLIVTDQVEDQEMIKILNGADVYVSTSRGEGLDISMVQSMALGKMVISDYYLGHTDYITDNNAIVYKHTYRPIIDSGSPFHNTKHKWASPDYISLCDSLQASYNLLEANKTEIGKNARDTVFGKYSEEQVVKQFKEDILKIAGPDEQKVRTSPWPRIPQITAK